MHEKRAKVPFIFGGVGFVGTIKIVSVIFGAIAGSKAFGALAGAM